MTPADNLRSEIDDKTRALVHCGYEGNASERLLDVVRAVSWRYFEHLFVEPDPESSTEATLKKALALRAGNVALSLFQSHETQQQLADPGTESAQRNRWADGTLEALGELWCAKHHLVCATTGLARLVQAGPSSFHFLFELRHSGLEALEREDAYPNLPSELEEEYAELWRSSIAIEAALAETVRRGGRNPVHVTDPGFQAHFRRIGEISARLMVGYDAFLPDSQFGGVSFELFRDVVGSLAGIGHEHFALSRAIGPQPGRSDRRVLAPVYQVSTLVDRLHVELDADPEKIRAVLDLLTLTPDNAPDHREAYDSALPPLVRWGPAHVALCSAGCIAAPMEFLLEELRSKHEKEWNIANQERESIWRDEIYAILPTDPKRFVVTRERKPIKRADKSELTDIDALVFDRSTGVLGLLQLKWQDVFARDMAKRASKSANFVLKAGDWVNRTHTWLRGRSMEKVFEQLSLRKRDAERCTEIKLIVLGRYFAHFSGQHTPDPRAAWGTWGQVQRLLAGTQQGPDEYRADPVRWLVEALRRDSPLNRMHEVSLEATHAELMLQGIHLRVELA